MLFSETLRTLEGGKLPGMGPYTYLDQSARPAAAAVRNQLEAMLSRYPEKERQALAARLISDEEDVHNAAFFELALHDLVMLSKRFKLAAIEPEIPGVLTKPDFLFVDAEEGMGFFLEAALVTGMADAEARRQLERDKVVGALYSVRHPSFRFHVRRVQLTAATASARAVQAAVVARLDRLADEVVCNPKAIDEELCIDIKGLQLELKAVARRPEESLDRPGVVSVSYGVRGVRAGAAIGSKVLRKAGRYGDGLGRPFFIAVNSTQVLQRDEDFEAALFGTLQFTWHGDEEELEPSRKRDGALLQGEKPRYIRVSGVLCFYNLTPWTLGTAKARILENPFAERPYNLQPLGLPTARAEGNELVTLAGKSLAELFGLPPGWPGD